MRNAGLALVVLGVLGSGAGCAEGTSSSGSESSSSSSSAAAERAAIEAAVSTPAETAGAKELGARTGASWTLREDPLLRTASFAAPSRGAGPRVLTVTRKGGELLSAFDVADVSQRATSFLAAHKDVLKLRAPAEELVTSRAAVDDLAMTHVRMQQVERGVPVAGAEVYAHFDGEGRLASLQQHYVPNLAALDVTPTVTSAAAETAASTALHAKKGAAVTVTTSSAPKLVISARGTDSALVWQLDVRVGARGSYRVLVDAHTGNVRSVLNRIQSVAGTGKGVFGVERKIEFTQQNGQNVLLDTTRAAPIRTLDARQSPNLTTARPVTSTSATAWDTAAQLAPGAAVDSHFWIAVTTDFYAKTLNHKGWDNKGGEQRIFTHVGDDQDGKAGWDNASYDPEGNQVSVGDGRDFCKPFAAFGDVLAHEFTHAVTSFHSNLEYVNQSGALNESISDIFGAIVEHSATPDPVKNWQVGEGIMLDGSASMRDMVKPENGQQPSHMTQFVQLGLDEDNGGVHVNSGIPNKAAQLMTVGGTHHVSNVVVAGKGIGWDNLAKVWHRANTTYLTESSDFAQAAKATLTAATDLKLSENDINTIDCAWKAVGVVQGTCVALKAEPTNTDPAPAPSTGTKSDDSDDDTTSTTSGGDDESTETPSKERPKKTTTPSKTGSAPAGAAGGCNGSGSRPTDYAFTLGLVAIAFLARRRRT